VTASPKTRSSAPRTAAASAPAPGGAEERLAASASPVAGAASTLSARVSVEGPRTGPGQVFAPLGDDARSPGGVGSRRHRKPPLTGLALMADRMPEAKLESGVRDILKDLEKHGHKVLAFHPWSSKHSAGGWPDWAFCTVRGFMVRELKKQREKPRADQQEWLDALTAAGVDADVWRPSSLLSGQIARELARLAGLGDST